MNNCQGLSFLDYRRNLCLCLRRDIDFDFDGGFSKLASFDIDLSFNSPPSAKKAKNIDLKKKVIPEDEDDDLAFDLKGYTPGDHDL